MKLMRRTWVKLWVNEWLDGTTRYQMSGAQRAFWVDLLAMAGRSRYPGIICSGMDGDRHVGYPLKTFAALDAGAEIDVLATLGLFQKTGKILVQITDEEPVRLYKLTICNWDRYQSEYQRQKGYRKSDNRKRSEVTAKVTTENTPRLLAEVEVEGEGEGEREGSRASHAPSSEPSAPSVSSSPSLDTLEQDTKAAAFEVFWEKWPRREAKPAARRAWAKIPIAEYSALMSGLEMWRKSEQWTRGIVPHAATWLNGKRWEDEVETLAPSNGAKGGSRAEQRTRNNLRAAGFIE